MYFYQFDEWEFYDLVNDPDELTNEYKNPEYADEVANMKAELERLRELYDDDSDVAEKPEEWKVEMRTTRSINN